MLTKPALPLSFVAPFLGALTVLLTLPPLNMPVWAAFISWGGAFLMEGKIGAGHVTRLLPALILGTSMGAVATLLSQWNERIYGTGGVAILIAMGISFLAAWMLITLGRFPLVQCTPATFLGFAALSATVATSAGPQPYTLFLCWCSATLMTCLGVALAWGTACLTEPWLFHLPPSRRVKAFLSQQRRFFLQTAAIMSLLPLATVLVLHARPIPTFSRAAGISPATGMGEAIFLSSERWGTLGDQGENDQIALSLTALPAASPGKTYYAWLLSDAGTSPETALLLGRLLPRQGKATLLYQGDSLHSNLLARFSRLLITEESANPPPLLPSPDQSSWFATSAFAPGVLASLRSLLSRDQALQSVGLEGGLLSWLLRNTQALLSRASSARDHATGRNSCLIHRQLVRILDFLDGTSMVRQDVSPGTPLLSDPQRGQVGLLQRDPLQRSPALLYLIGLQDQSLLVSPGLTHAQWIAGLHIMSLLNQVNQSFEEVRTLAHQLVRMTPDQLMQPLGLSLLDQLVNAASIAYAGQAPVGTASLQGGVLQIVAQVQQLATLALDACRESGAATKAPLLSVPLHCSPQGNLRLN